MCVELYTNARIIIMLSLCHVYRYASKVTAKARRCTRELFYHACVLRMLTRKTSDVYGS